MSERIHSGRGGVLGLRVNREGEGNECIHTLIHTQTHTHHMYCTHVSVHTIATYTPLGFQNRQGEVCTHTHHEHTRAHTHTHHAYTL